MGELAATAGLAVRPARERAPANGTVTVVLTSCNEGERLRATVEGLQATIGTEPELIVVDDGSTDGSTDFLADADQPVRLVRPPDRLGITGARNYGAAAATGDVLVFSDAHVSPEPGWLEPLVEALAVSSVGVVAPVVSAMDRTWDKGYGFTWRDPSLTMSWLDRQDSAEPYPVPFLCGCFIAIRRRCFEEVGGFDEGFRRWGSEDAELSLRLWLLGLECRVVPDSEIAHLFRPAFPYEVHWPWTLHNVLRLATLHLGERALEAVIGHHAGFPAFGEAYANLVTSNVWAQRDHLRRVRRLDGDWFVDCFAIDALR